jgi:hypothetical protein
VTAALSTHQKRPGRDVEVLLANGRRGSLVRAGSDGDISDSALY